MVALSAAAERAAALGAHEQAMRFIDQALEVTADRSRQAELLERAGASASEAARHEAAEAYLDRAVGLHRAGSDRVAMARTIAALGAVLNQGRQNQRALALLEPASVEFADLAPDAALVALEGQLARAFMLREDDARALETVERVLAAAERADLVAILADALVTKGSALVDMGRAREGVGVIEAGERLARASGLAATAMRGLNNRLASQIMIDPRASLEDVHEGLRLAHRTGSRGWAFTLTEKRDQALWYLGDWDTVLESMAAGLQDDPEASDRTSLLAFGMRIHVCRGESVATESHELERAAAGVTDPQTLFLVVEARAWAALGAGQRDEAERLWREALRRYQIRAEEWLYMAGSMAMRRGDAPNAVKDLEMIDQRGLHHPLIEARRLVLRAGLTALAGDAAGSVRLFDSGLRIFRELATPFEEALAVLVMASVLDAELPEVHAAVDRARELLTQLRAGPYLDQLDAAAGRTLARVQPGAA